MEKEQAQFIVDKLTKGSSLPKFLFPFSQLCLRLDGRVYICGDVMMAKQVEESIVACLVKNNAMSNSQALDYVSKMKEDKRWLTDLFGLTLNVEKTMSFLGNVWDHVIAKKVLHVKEAQKHSTSKFSEQRRQTSIL